MSPFVRDWEVKWFESADHRYLVKAALTERPLSCDEALVLAGELEWAAKEAGAAITEWINEEYELD